MSTSIASHYEREFDIDSLCLTPYGEELAEVGPQVVEAFLDESVRLYSGIGTDYNRDQYIGGGFYGHVYEFYQRDEMCIKIVSPSTIKRPKGEWGNVCLSVPNLKTETRFIHALHAFLAEREEANISVPTQYAVAKFAQGYALLQERIPREYVTFRQLINDALSNDDRAMQAHLNERELAVANRVKRVLRYSPLRFGITDFDNGKRRGVNSGNVFIERDSVDSDTGQVYIIDLVDRARRNHARAALATLLSGRANNKVQKVEPAGSSSLQQEELVAA
jgi:hypothetical protein